MPCFEAFYAFNCEYGNLWFDKNNRESVHFHKIVFFTQKSNQIFI